MPQETLKVQGEKCVVTSGPTRIGAYKSYTVLKGGRERTAIRINGEWRWLREEEEAVEP